MRLFHKSNEPFESFASSNDHLNNAYKREGHPVEAILIYEDSIYICREVHTNCIKQFL